MINITNGKYMIEADPMEFDIKEEVHPNDIARIKNNTDLKTLKSGSN